eukprot:SAG31_NODE_14012_length_832_cov_0.799454_2_plen_117_part_00
MLMPQLLLRRYHPKMVISCALFANALTCLAFAVTPSECGEIGQKGQKECGLHWMLIGARAVLGITQGFITCYTPVWVDDFAPSDRKTSWCVVSPTRATRHWMLSGDNAAVPTRFCS